MNHVQRRGGGDKSYGPFSLGGCIAHQMRAVMFASHYVTEDSVSVCTSWRWKAERYPSSDRIDLCCSRNKDKSGRKSLLHNYNK